MKAKLKLAEVVPELLPVPPVKGGAVETLVYDLAKLLSDKFDVTVVSRPSQMTGSATSISRPQGLTGFAFP